jgi:hypothetical protein
MNETLYPQYMRMSEERLRKHLHKKETPPAIVNDIVEVVLRQREQLRTERIKKTVHKKVWDEILQPLRKEIKLVTASLLYSPSTNNPTLDDQPRKDALTGYQMVLIKLREKLTGWMEEGKQTPHQMAADKRIPNNGEHWADWIPDHIQAAVENEFAKITYTPRAKRKIPFTRSSAIPARLRRLMKRKGMLDYRIALIEREQMIDALMRVDESTNNKLIKLREDLSLVNKQIGDYEHARRSEK